MGRPRPLFIFVLFNRNQRDSNSDFWVEGEYADHKTTTFRHSFFCSLCQLISFWMSTLAVFWQQLYRLSSYFLPSDHVSIWRLLSLSHTYHCTYLSLSVIQAILLYLKLIDAMYLPTSLSRFHTSNPSLFETYRRHVPTDLSLSLSYKQFFSI